MDLIISELLLLMIVFSCLEHMLSIEQFRINKGWGIISLADHKDFCGLLTRSFGLGLDHLLEQLLEDPTKRQIIGGSKHLGDKVPSLSQETGCQLESKQHEL